MGLFSKKKQVKPTGSQSLPSLPELPKLPDLPSMNFEEDADSRQIHKLPSFPSSPMGKKFSQDTIKGAVTGEEEDDSGDANANDFADYDEEDEEQMMPEPLKRPRTHEMSLRGNFSQSKSTVSAEPVFIRVDKFEDAMKVFNDTRKKMENIEKILKDLKGIKEKEDQELTSWENEIMSLKDQIEKVNTDIFSKI